MCQQQRCVPPPTPIKKHANMERSYYNQGMAFKLVPELGRIEHKGEHLAPKLEDLSFISSTYTNSQAQLCTHVVLALGGEDWRIRSSKL